MKKVFFYCSLITSCQNNKSITAKTEQQKQSVHEITIKSSGDIIIDNVNTTINEMQKKNLTKTRFK